jgi:hypothetical protein
VRGGAGMFFGPRSPNQQTLTLTDGVITVGAFGGFEPNRVARRSRRRSRSGADPTRPHQRRPEQVYSAESAEAADPYGGFQQQPSGGGLSVEPGRTVSTGTRPVAGGGVHRRSRHAPHHQGQPEPDSVGPRHGRLHHAGGSAVPERGQSGGDGFLDGETTSTTRSTSASKSG